MFYSRLFLFFLGSPFFQGIDGYIDQPACLFLPFVGGYTKH